MVYLFIHPHPPDFDSSGVVLSYLRIFLPIFALYSFVVKAGNFHKQLEIVDKNKEKKTKTISRKNHPHSKYIGNRREIIRESTISIMASNGHSPPLLFLPHYLLCKTRRRRTLYMEHRMLFRTC